MKIPLYHVELVPDGEFTLPDDLTEIRNSRDAARLLRCLIGQWETEEAWAVYLSDGLRVRWVKCLGRGEKTFARVELRKLLAVALRRDSDSLLIGHSHPSGAAVPSLEDRMGTWQIEGAAQLVGSRLVDHVIVTPDRHFSFMDEKLLIRDEEKTA